MSRKRIEIDWKKVDGMCAIFCTQEEISGVLGCSVDTLERACVRDHKIKFAEYSKQHRSRGKMSLRRLQFESARRGNTTMLKHLGNNYLGQSDKVEHFGSGDKPPIQMSVTEKQARLAKVKKVLSGLPD
jgi:hypothetical protein